MSDDDCSERKIVVANDTQSAKKKNPKLKPSVSGFNLEMRSDEVSERWRLFGTKKRRRERYAVRDDAGAGGGNRTRTPLLAMDFESTSSTSSNTPA